MKHHVLHFTFRVVSAVSGRKTLIFVVSAVQTPESPGARTPISARIEWRECRYASTRIYYANTQTGGDISLRIRVILTSGIEILEIFLFLFAFVCVGQLFNSCDRSYLPTRDLRLTRRFAQPRKIHRILVWYTSFDDNAVYTTWTAFVSYYKTRKVCVTSRSS